MPQSTTSDSPSSPLIIHGRIHGGIAQGAGEALLEHCHYDAQDGQLLAASLMTVPRRPTCRSMPPI